MERPKRTSILWLCLAGLASALLTISGAFRGDFAYLFSGAHFGLTVAVYFVVYEAERNPLKLAAFVCACAAAYLVAEFSAFELEKFFPVNGSMGSARLDIPMAVFFGAGCVGALLVFAAGAFLFAARTMQWSSLGTVALWSLGGGILGVLGGGADSIRTKGTFQTMYLLYLVWQPGAAVLLGLLLNRLRAPKGVPLQAANKGTVDLAIKANFGIVILSVIFFTSLFGFLGFRTYQTIRVSRIAAVRLAAQQRAMAEAPSRLNLPNVEASPVDQAVIVSEIGGFYPWIPNSHTIVDSPTEIHYSVGYTVTKDPLTEPYQRVVAVDISQFPTAEWARYRVKYPLAHDVLSASQYLTRISRFGQNVVQDTTRRYPDGGGTLCYLWPSGNFAVNVCYEAPQVNEEFLRRYLEKYPSSL